jgi:hypothetical protein
MAARTQLLRRHHPALPGEVEDAVLSAYKVWVKNSNSGTKNGTFTNMHNVNVSDDDIGF